MMCPSEETNRATRQEWRELGFYYDRDDSERAWILKGSKQGLLKLSEILKAYTQNNHKSGKSEHIHLGPYMYLKIITWNEAHIGEQGVYGSQKDLKRLANQIEGKLMEASPNQIFEVAEEYAGDKDYSMTLYVMREDFDPAEVDPELL